ncbi:MAG: CotH kinase family protein [Verrucomicrobiales bacterium]
MIHPLYSAGSFEIRAVRRRVARGSWALGWVVLGLLWLAGPAAGQLRLTEIQVVNTTGATDEDGTVQPWVEIWNSSQTAKVAMNNYKFTDGTVTWTFPPADIMPDEHMIVWLSGKNRKVSTAPLHTDFVPNPAGGTISLFNAAATPVLLSKFDYPAQSANVSWGRDASDTAVTPTVTGFYSIPTPNLPNNYEGAGFAGKVLFSHSSRAFSGSMEVTLAVAPPDSAAEIRYTATSTLAANAPSTLPSATSTLYTGPIAVTATTMIRARVFTPGKLPGETETQSFLLLNATTETFSSSIPTVVVTNFGRSTPLESPDQPSFMWVWEPTDPDNRSRLTNLPTFTSRTVIDRRGSSTAGNAKHNLNLETRQAFNEEQLQYPLLGMPFESDWVLHAPFDFDRSLIHNPLAYALSNSLGRYASRNRMAEVFIDTNGSSLNFTGAASGDYFGVYNILEKIRRNNDRVDVRRLEKYDNDDVSKTGGWIWKVDRLDSGDTGFSAGGQSFAYYYPKEIEVKSPQRDPQEQYLAKNTNPTAANPLPAGYIKQFADALNSAGFTNPVTGYAKYLDVPPAIDHHLHNVWTFNVDALRLSGYWTKERGAKMYPGPVWDFDRALCSTDGRDLDPKTWRSKTGDMGTDFFNFTWWNRLFRDPDFYQKYIDRWQELRRPGQPFAAPVVNALIDSLNAQIGDEAVTRDYNRWRQQKRPWTSPFTGTKYLGFPGTGSTPAIGQASEIQRIKDWMQQRADFFDTQWVGPVTASLPDSNVATGTPVTLTGPAGATIYYTVNGADPRPTGGAVSNNVPALSPGTMVYSGPITISATSRIRARAFKPTHTALTGSNNPPLVSKWGGLLNVRYATDPPAAAGTLVISEIQYNPTAPTQTELAVNPLWEASDFEFVELYNPSNGPVDLLGVAIAEGITFGITGGDALSLAPGGSVVLASDPAAMAARHGSAIGPVLGGFGGSLSNGGELLTLRAASGNAIFSVTYDDAWHPTTDGSGPSLVVYDPQATAATYNGPGNWRPSAGANGSPGGYDPRSAPRPDGGSAPAGPFNALSLSGRLDGGLGGTAAPTTQWSVVDGPGTGTIIPADALVATAAFSEPGVYTLRLTGSDGQLTRTDDVLVYAQETPASWLAGYPGIGSLDNDAEGDGRSNFLEYALQTDPTVPQAGEPPMVTVERGLQSLTFTKLSPTSAVTYLVQISTDLITWRAPITGELVEEILATDGFTQTVKITDTVPVAIGEPRYLRLKVTSATP